MNEISDDVGMAPETMDMGGAPPHTDTLIRPAACGRGKIGLFKSKAPVCKALSLASPFHRSPTRARTTRTVRWTLDKLSRRIKDFVNAVTSQNQQRNDAFISTQNQHQIASVIPTRLPGDVTQQRCEPTEIPRATRGNHVETESKQQPA